MKKIILTALCICSFFAHAQSKGSEVYVGEVVMMANTYAPLGYLPCDGSLYSIMSYQVLYAVIGNTYGGDGVNTFAVPDLRGRIPVGDGSGMGLTPRYTGQRSGSETGTVTESQLPAHDHAFTSTSQLKGSISAGDSTNGSGKVLARLETDAYSSQTPNAETAAGSLVMDGSVSTGSTGQGSSHYNLMPYTVINYYIAYDGYFPQHSKDENNK